MGKRETSLAAVDLRYDALLEYPRCCCRKTNRLLKPSSRCRGRRSTSPRYTRNSTSRPRSARRSSYKREVSSEDVTAVSVVCIPRCNRGFSHPPGRATRLTVPFENPEDGATPSATFPRSPGTAYRATTGLYARSDC